MGCHTSLQPVEAERGRRCTIDCHCHVLPLANFYPVPDANRLLPRSIAIGTAGCEGDGLTSSVFRPCRRESCWASAKATDTSSRKPPIAESLTLKFFITATSMSAINKVDQVSLLACISHFPNRQITIQPAIGVVAEIRLSAVEQIKFQTL